MSKQRKSPSPIGSFSLLQFHGYYHALYRQLLRGRYLDNDELLFHLGKGFAVVYTVAHVRRSGVTRYDMFTVWLNLVFSTICSFVWVFFIGFLVVSGPTWSDSSIWDKSWMLILLFLLDFYAPVIPLRTLSSIRYVRKLRRGSPK